MVIEYLANPGVDAGRADHLLDFVADFVSTAPGSGKTKLLLMNHVLSLRVIR
jgi:hypothetical protein